MDKLYLFAVLRLHVLTIDQLLIFFSINIILYVRSGNGGMLSLSGGKSRGNAKEMPRHYPLVQRTPHGRGVCRIWIGSKGEFSSFMYTSEA